MFIINIIIGIFLSYLYSKLILPKNSGEIPKIDLTLYPIFYRGMIILPLTKTKALHLHHWITYSITIYFYKYIEYNLIIYYFLLGLIFQGLMYNDSLNLLIKNPY